MRVVGMGEATTLQGVRYEMRSLPGSGDKRVNEDYALVSVEDACAVLVDGATGLTKANLIAGTSDAAWYASSLAEACRTRLADESVATSAALGDAGREVSGRYLALPGAAELRREDLPNGSLAVLRWLRMKLEVTMLGDCTAVLVMRDGTARVVHDDLLDALDQGNYARMFAYATEHGTDMAEARVAINDWFIHNRLKMNQPDGYWAADIGCGGFGHELVRTFPLEDVSFALICSDGCAAAVDMEVADDMVVLARRVASGDGDALLQELRAAEQADAACWEHPRSKISDDTTYVALWF